MAFKCEQVRILSQNLPDVARWQSYAEDLHALGIKGQGIEVAVVDSGAWMDDPVTAAAVVGGVNLSGVGDPNDLQDRVGHGGLVTAIILKIAPLAKIRVIRIFGDTGYCTEELAGQGLKLAAESQAHLANASIGGPKHPTITDAVAAFAARKKPLIVAAGNEGDGDGTTVELSAPADEDHPTVVGAVDRGRLADTSWDFLPLRPAVYSNSNPKVDGVAIGRIPEVWNEGTSFAAPVVAGLSALWASYCLLTGRPWDDQENYSWLRSGARQLPGFAPKNDQTGFGFFTTRPFQPPRLLEHNPQTGETWLGGQPYTWGVPPIAQDGRLYFYGVELAKCLGGSGIWNADLHRAQYRN